MANIRHRTAAVALCTLFLSGSATAAAFASTPYPPGTPTPTVSGIKATATDPSDPQVEAQRASSLPRTGTDVALWVLAGGALVAGGSAMVAGSRRRVGGHSR